MSNKYFLIIIIILLSFLSSYAQVPQLVNYQGMLTDDAGVPVTGTYSIEFRIYNTETGGTAIWNETQSVTATDGIFNVILGAATAIPYSVFNGGDKYLALKIDTDPEMSPRKRLISVGYAFRSYDSDKLDGVDATAFVTTVDNVTPTTAGNIDLEAGSNITITPNDASHKITIAASGGGGGDITAVNAGGGLEGGGTSGDVTLQVKFPLVINGFSSDYAIRGDNGGTGGHGILGQQRGTFDAGYAVYGDKINANNEGGLGGRYYGVYGETNNDVAIKGMASDLSVWGEIASTNDSRGVRGHCTSGGEGVYGSYGSSTRAYLASSTRAVYGEHGDVYGYIGAGNRGVHGQYDGTHYGFLGTSAYGVYGRADDSGDMGVYGSSSSGYGIRGYSSSGYAGYFTGKVRVGGDFTVTGSKSFIIDHPLDPANQYLYHYCLESDEMANVYSGNVMLDGAGEATVTLPDWFDALNEDFRYQLTCIGGYAQVYIAEKVVNNQFRIAGGKPGMEVSWQITGVRKDAYAKAHPAKIEVEKQGDERGKYLSPKEHGMPVNAGFEYDDIQRLEQEDKRVAEEMQEIDSERQRALEIDQRAARRDADRNRQEN